MSVSCLPTLVPYMGIRPALDQDYSGVGQCCDSALLVLLLMTPASHHHPAPLSASVLVLAALFGIQHPTKAPRKAAEGDPSAHIPAT